MRYVRFNPNTNVSVESKVTEEVFLMADGWHVIPDSVEQMSNIKLMPDGTIRPMTPEEIADWIKPLRLNSLLISVRAQRDSLLSQSDWTELPSVSSQHDTAWNDNWKKYRQTLRDIPNTVTDPDVPVVWPIPPNA